MIPCPHCGSSDWVYIHVRPAGWYRAYFEEVDGGIAGIDEEVDAAEPGDCKTVWCSKCGKRRRDLYVENDVLRQEKSRLPTGHTVKV